MNKITAAITAVGGYLPEYVLTNAELEKMVDTTDDWITSRTGIKERHILKGEGLGSSYMAIKAANEVIRKRGIDPKEIDMVLVCTATPDMPVAATATYTATQIGAVNAFYTALRPEPSLFNQVNTKKYSSLAAIKCLRLLTIRIELPVSFLEMGPVLCC